MTTTPTVITNASIHNILHFAFFIITVTIRKNITVGKLEKLQKVFTIKFDLFPASISGGSWKNVIHFTQDSECCEIGSGVPGLWYRNVSGQCEYYLSYPVTGLNWMKVATTNDIMIGKWNTIEILQRKEHNKYFFIFSVNDIVRLKIENPTPLVFANVEVWVGNWVSPALPGYLKYLIIEGKVIFIFLTFNSPSPPPPPPWMVYSFGAIFCVILFAYVMSSWYFPNSAY